MTSQDMWPLSMTLHPAPPVRNTFVHFRGDDQRLARARSAPPEVMVHIALAEAIRMETELESMRKAAAATARKHAKRKAKLAVERDEDELLDESIRIARQEKIEQKWGEFAEAVVMLSRAHALAAAVANAARRRDEQRRPRHRLTLEPYVFLEVCYVIGVRPPSYIDMCQRGILREKNGMAEIWISEQDLGQPPMRMLMSCGNKHNYLHGINALCLVNETRMTSDAVVVQDQTVEELREEFKVPPHARLIHRGEELRAGQLVAQGIGPGCAVFICEESDDSDD